MTSGSHPPPAPRNLRNASLSSSFLRHQLRSGTTRTVPPAIVKKEPEGISSKKRPAEGPPLMIIDGDSPADFWTACHGLFTPATKKRCGESSVDALLNGTGLTAWKMVQDMLALTAKFKEEMLELEKKERSLAAKLEDANKTKVSLGKQCQTLTQQLEDAQVKITSLESAVGKAKSEVGAVASYFAMQSRIDTIQEHVDGLSGSWDLEGEKAAFAANYPPDEPIPAQAIIDAILEDIRAETQEEARAEADQEGGVSGLDASSGPNQLPVGVPLSDSQPPTAPPAAVDDGQEEAADSADV